MTDLNSGIWAMFMKSFEASLMAKDCSTIFGFLLVGSNENKLFINKEFLIQQPDGVLGFWGTFFHVGKTRLNYLL